MKTPVIKAGDLTRAWHLVDAADFIVGRLATRIATVLRGKHKPSFTPHLDNGDFVVVVNADKVVFTGNKEDKKNYYHYSGYQGGMRVTSASEMREKHPERILFFAVKGMLPKGPLGRAMMKKLKIYNGVDHPHGAQMPKPMAL